MLVYLDTSHLSLLADRGFLFPGGVTAFQRAWRQSTSVLALSPHHAQETAQLERGDSIRRRLSTIAAFPELRFGTAMSFTAIECEIKVQILSLLKDEKPRYCVLREALFPPSTFQDFERAVLDPELLGKYARSRAILLGGADLKNLFNRGFREIRGLLKSLGLPDQGGARIPNLEEARKAAMEVLGQHPLWEQLIDAWFDARVREGTDRAAWESSFGLREVRVIDRVPDDDLSQIGNFFGVLAPNACRELTAASGVPQEQLMPLIPQLDPYECPGFALKLAVTRARNRTQKVAKAGDEVDSDHLVFAPHVDVAFVDKNTLESVRQESESTRALVSPASTRSLRWAGNLEGVLKIIEEEGDKISADIGRSLNPTAET